MTKIHERFVFLTKGGIRDCFNKKSNRCFVGSGQVSKYFKI